MESPFIWPTTASSFMALESVLCTNSSSLFLDHTGWGFTPCHRVREAHSKNWFRETWANSSGEIKHTFYHFGKKGAWGGPLAPLAMEVGVWSLRLLWTLTTRKEAIQEWRQPRGGFRVSGIAALAWARCPFTPWGCWQKEVKAPVIGNSECPLMESQAHGIMMDEVSDKILEWRTRETDPSDVSRQETRFKSSPRWCWWLSERRWEPGGNAQGRPWAPREDYLSM